MAQTGQVQLRITGMHCAGCASRVEEALRGVEGVRDASVHLMNHSATVTPSGAPVSAAQLVSAVRGAGYGAEVLSSRDALATIAADETAHREEQRRHRQALIQAIGLVLPILAIDHFRHVLWSHDDGSQIAARLMEMVLLAMLAVSPAGAPILVSGLRALVFRAPNMDLLITMGVVVAFLSSVYGTFIARDDSFVHLHAAAMILGLVCVGRYLEARARGRASAAMSALARLAPKTALVRRDGQLVSTPVEALQSGDEVSVPPHTGIPADGEVLEGTAAIDESLMTGESVPVTRGPGEQVLGGTLVIEGQIVFRVTATGARAALGRIAQLVARAQSAKTAMQRLADRVAAVFTPIIIALAAATLIGWIVIYGSDGLAGGARAAIAVLVVACPCALGLATPTVVSVASGVAALRGIFVRDASMLEAMSAVDVVVWDKTGTLTEGKPVVQSVHTFGGWSEEDVLRLAAAAQQLSSHPISRAITAHARDRNLMLVEPAKFESVPGAGVVSTINDSDLKPKQIVVGSARLLSARGVDLAPIAEYLTGLSRMHALVAIDGVAVAIVELRDAVRPGASEAIQRLARLGIRSEMLTGDAEPVARGVCEQLGIEEYRAAVDPAGKIERIEQLKASGRRVAMVGDGVNDAAALASADVGIAFATGADVAGEAAGIHLVGASPMLVPRAVEISRASVRIIRQNLFWAFFYNVLMIPLAALGKLPPAFAAGAMMVSSLTVVLNALRLKRKGIVS